MKLRNKKTGEVIDPLQRSELILDYDSLAELNEEWEDYEEPKEHWYIEPNGVIARIDEWDCCTASDIEIMKTLGNYFETKEEAEKAVEKLKAWKRLKDKSFKLINYNCPLRKLYFEVDGGKFFEASGEVSEETRADLTLLFGGEE